MIIAASYMPLFGRNEKPLTVACVFSGKMLPNPERKAILQIRKSFIITKSHSGTGLEMMGKRRIMIQNMPVQLLGEKMKELENALFVSETNALAKLPTHIVQIVEVDEAGNAWFIIPRPTQVIESFGEEMPAKLDLFKKGKGFYLKIRGIASLIQAEEDLPKTNIFQELSGSFKKKEVVAVKLKMQSADYFDSSPKTVPNPVRNIGSMVYNWLMDPLFNVKQPQLVTIPVYAENS